MNKGKAGLWRLLSCRNSTTAWRLVVLIEESKTSACVGGDDESAARRRPHQGQTAAGKLPRVLLAPLFGVYNNAIHGRA